MADQPCDDILKRRFDTMGCGRLQDRIKAFNNAADDSQKKLVVNPFSETYKLQKHKGKMHYGRPETGSKSQQRGIKAGNHVYKEILELCEVINWIGIERPDGAIIVDFGTLFNLYTRISDKVVGMLLRARKYGLVQFDGEILYQRRDEGVIITMPLPYREIKERFKYSGDPANLGKLVTDEGAETVLADTITSKYRRNTEPGSETTDKDEDGNKNSAPAAGAAKLSRTVSEGGQQTFKVPEFSTTYGTTSKSCKGAGVTSRSVCKKRNRKVKSEESTEDLQPNHEDSSSKEYAASPTGDTVVTASKVDDNGDRSSTGDCVKPNSTEISADSQNGDAVSEVETSAKLTEDQSVVADNSPDVHGTESTAHTNAESANDRKGTEAERYSSEMMTPDNDLEQSELTDGLCDAKPKVPDSSTQDEDEDNVKEKVTETSKTSKDNKSKTTRAEKGGKRTSRPERRKERKMINLEIAVQ